jgi:hypothetical protein
MASQIWRTTRSLFLIALQRSFTNRKWYREAIWQRFSISRLIDTRWFIRRLCLYSLLYKNINLYGGRTSTLIFDESRILHTYIVIPVLNSQKEGIAKTIPSRKWKFWNPEMIHPCMKLTKVRLSDFVEFFSRRAIAKNEQIKNSWGIQKLGRLAL